MKLPRTISLMAIVMMTAFATSASAQQTTLDAAGIAAARNLLKISGSVDAMIAAMRASLPAQRAQMPDLPAEFWTQFEERMVRQAPELADSIAVIYAQKFSVAEMKEISAFYGSAVGRKMVSTQPAIIAESSILGQRWGGRIGEEIGKTLFGEE